MTLLVEKKDIQENVEDVLKFCLQYMLKMGCHGATELNCTYRYKYLSFHFFKYDECCWDIQFACQVGLTLQLEDDINAAPF